MNKTPQNTTKTILKPEVIDPKPIKTQSKDITNSQSEIVPNNQGQELSYYKKTREYKQFLKLIKNKQTIPAVILAQTLGVNRNTIIKWLKTPKALQVLAQDIDYHIQKISNSKDWRASAYVLDKLSVPIDTNETKSDLKQLIVINT